MMVTAQPAYDELVDLFADPVVAERILHFHPSPTMQARIEVLLEKNRQEGLTSEEQDELDEVERLEHFMRLIKARVRQKLRTVRQNLGRTAEQKRPHPLSLS